MKRRIMAAAILLAVILSGLSFVSAGVDNNSDECYILIEAGTGCVLDSKDADKQVNCGYLSKLMSILLIAEDIETGKYTLDTELTASESVRGTSGSVIWLEPGDKLSVEELLKGVIIGNANDALTVLAERSEGSIEQFVSRMNSEAFDLGMRNTAFYSPYGYDDEREYTTAMDISTVCRQLVKYDFLRDYFKTWRDFVKNGKVELVNENNLSRTYPAQIGLKAAHSERAGYCIAEAAESEEGICYIAVVLGAPDSDNSHAKAKELCRKGIREYKVTATLFPDDMMMPVKVKKGVAGSVNVRLREQSSLVVSLDTKEIRTVAVIPKYLNAPIKKGQIVGYAGFYNGKTLIHEADIVADEAVERISFLDAIAEVLVNIVK